jgi:heme-degrading monooxygenase HmoA
MPVIFLVEATKPSDAKFFSEYSEENRQTVQELNVWMRSLPGFINHTTTRHSPDMIVTETTWETIENYVDWKLARDKRPEQIERVIYNQVNKISASINLIT